MDVVARVCALCWIGIAIFTFNTAPLWRAPLPAALLAVAFGISVGFYMRHRVMATTVLLVTLGYAIALIWTTGPHQIPWLWVGAVTTKPISILCGFVTNRMAASERRHPILRDGAVREGKRVPGQDPKNDLP